MEPSGIDKGRAGGVMGSLRRMKGLFGSKRNLVAPFIIAAVLASAVGLFMLVSDSLLSPALRSEDLLDYMWDMDTMPGFIMPTGQDWITPEGEYPEDRELFTVSGAENTVYLRCFVASYYDGSMWKQNPNSKSSAYNGEHLTYEVDDYSSQVTDNITITPIEEFSPGFIPTSLYTTRLTSDDILQYYPEEYMFFLSQDSEQEYQFSTTHYYFDDEVLKNKDVIDDPAYLQLPGNITQRTRDLAVEITEDYDSTYEKALAIETYLLANYEFSIEYSSSPGELSEPTDWFLFEEKKGIHTNFSSAFVVLCRCAGLPARLMSGYYIEPTGDEQTVHTLQATCLGEVGYEDVGWIVYNSVPPTEGMGIQIETFTYIDEPINGGNPVEKGVPFYVSGSVETQEGMPIVGMPVVVWLWQGDPEDKPEFVDGLPDKPAFYVAAGIMENEGYNVECMVPADITAGNWNVIVQALGIEPFFLPSDSDPGIVIQAPSAIHASMPDEAEVGVPFVISGTLTDATNSSIAVADAQINVTIENSDTGVVAASLSDITDSSGDFSLSHTFDDIGDIGNYDVTISFDGNDYYLPAQAEGEVEVSIATELTITTPDQIKLDSTLPIAGTLSDSLGGALAGRTIHIYYDDVLLTSVITDASGDYSYDYTFDVSGDHSIRVEYAGEEYYLPDALTHDIRVYGPPTLTLEIPEEDWDVSIDDNGNGIYEQSEQRLYSISGSLINEFGDPLPFTEVDFWYIKGASEQHFLTLITDINGNYSEDIYATAVGEYTIKAVFEETALYPGTEDSSDITVWMPTTLSMDALDDHIKLDTTLTIEGYLLDDAGDPVSGKTIYIMDDTIELGTATTDGTGHYSFDYLFDEPGDYEIYAVFNVDHAEFYRASQTSPYEYVRVYSAPTIDLTVPAEYDINDQPVGISGHLYDEYGNDLEGYTVTITYSDGSPGTDVTTGAGGLFSTAHTFADVGDYTVTASFAGSGYYPAAADEVAPIKIMMPTTLSVTIQPEAKVNTVVTISGTLEDADSNPLAGQTITLMDGATTIATVVTQPDGSYTYDHTFTTSGDHTVNASFARTGYLKSSADSDNIRVYGPPTIDLTVPYEADVDQAVTISGHLYDEYGNDLSGETIIIQYTDGSPDDSETTDANGEFSTTHTFAAVGNYTVTAVFNETALYPGTNDSSPITVWMPTTLSMDPLPDNIKEGTTLIIEGDLLDNVSAGVSGKTIYIMNGATELASVTTDGSGHYSYSYNFSQSGDYEIYAVFNVDVSNLFRASESTPHENVRVYGEPALVLTVPAEADVNQSVTISGHLYDEYGNDISDTVDIYVDDGSGDVLIAQPTTDGDGLFSITHTFAVVGNYTVTAVFNETALYPGMDADSPITVWMPTTLSMDPLPGDIKLSTALIIEGDLLDDAGDPVVGATIHIMDGATEITTVITDGSGHYSYSYNFTQSGDYAIYAVFDVDNANLLRASQSTPHENVRVYGEPTVDLTVPAEADVNASVAISGHLYDEYGNDLVGETVVIQYSDGSPGDVLTTVAGGLFSTTHTFAAVGNYSVTAVFSETALYPETNASANITVVRIDVTLTVDVPALVMIDTPVTVDGTLTDISANPLEGQDIEIDIVSIDDSSHTLINAVTDVGGNFSASQDMSVRGEYSVTVSFYQTGYYNAATYQTTFMVLTEPLMTLDAPDSAEQWNQVQISGTLIDEMLGPVEGADITFSIGGVEVEIDDPVVTDADGAFVVDYVFVNTGDYVIVASYSGSYAGDLLMETDASSGIRVVGTDYSVVLGSVKGLDYYLSWAVNIIAALAGAYVAYLIGRKLISKYTLSISGGGIAIGRKTTSSESAGVLPVTSSIAIDFPDAQAPLADIWGINEELRVLIRLFDKNGLVLPDRKVEVLINGKLTDAAATDAAGSIVLRYTFDAPGMYEVSCFFKGDENEGACNAGRMIRVVDFRSEAVGLYDAVVKAARRKGARTSKKLTPREVERVIVAAVKRIDQGMLDRFIGYAEEALYSSHDFTRKSYIDMLVIYKPVFAFIEEV